MVAGVLCRLFNACAPSENDQIGERDHLAVGLRDVEILAYTLKSLEHVRKLSRIVDFPTLLRCKSNAGAVCSAALVGTPECRSRGPGSRYQLRNGQTRCEYLVYQES